MKLSLVCSTLLPLALLAQNPPPAAPSAAPPSLAAPATPAPATAPSTMIPPDQVVLVIGDRKFTRAEFELLIQKGMAEKMSQTDRRKMAVGIASVITLAAEARRQALDQTPYAKENIEIVADQWLANALVTKEVADKPLDDAVLKDYYDKHQAQFDEVTARHILIRVHGARVPIRPVQKDLTPEEALARAQDLKKQLDAGADFAALAKAESDDTGSAKNGGLLPVFKRGSMMPEFEKAAFDAEVGKVTDPVKTIFGYHLILVTDHKLKPFDEAKVDIERQLKPQLEKDYVEKIRTRTPITIDEAYFGKPEAPAPTLMK